MTTREAPKRSCNSRRYSSAFIAANARVKGSTSTRSMPQESSNSFFSSREVRSLNSRASCCKTVLGCGQNVTTMVSSPL